VLVVFPPISAYIDYQENSLWPFSYAFFLENNVEHGKEIKKYISFSRLMYHLTTVAYCIIIMCQLQW